MRDTAFMLAALLGVSGLSFWLGELRALRRYQVWIGIIERHAASKPTPAPPEEEPPCWGDCGSAGDFVRVTPASIGCGDCDMRTDTEGE